MTSAATTPELKDYQDEVFNRPHMNGFNEVVHQGIFPYSFGVANSSLPLQMVVPRCVFGSYPGTGDYKITLTQYGEDSDALIIMDFGEAARDFPVDHQDVIRFLRGNGRPIVAEKLIAMLEDAREDPDECPIGIVSLRDMAWFLVGERAFSDPFIGPDRRGIVHAQWRFNGNGVLVISFLGYGEILLVAQADESPVTGMLDISKRGPEREIMEEFGHLVPRRY